MKQSHKLLFVAVCVSTNLITFLVVYSLNQPSITASVQCKQCSSISRLLQTCMSPSRNTTTTNNVSTETHCPECQECSECPTSSECPPQQECPSGEEETEKPRCVCESSSNQRTKITNYNASLPVIYMISPTYKRLTQKSDLTSVCATVTNVQNLVWIVIEDASEKTKLVTNLLKHCKVTSVHLNVLTPDYFKQNKARPRGVEQRNAGLAWIREHNTKEDCNGIIYFGDDDNSYDLRLFDVMRKTEKVSVWPVAFSGGVKIEGPECEGGRVARWHNGWGAERTFPIDMAGFAIHLCLMMNNPSVVIGRDKMGRYSKPGYLESNILEQLIDKEFLECIGLSDEVIVWHVKTTEPDVLHENRTPSNPDIEV